MALITHYFVYVGHSTQTKNKLQKEFFDYLVSLKGTLIDAIKLQFLKKQILEKAQELNDKYSRCNPIVIQFGELYPKTGFLIYGFSFLTFQIHEAYYNDNLKV